MSTINQEVSIGGSVVFWTLSNSTDHGIMKEGLEGIGLGRFVPEVQTPYAALKNSLVRTFGSRRTLIRDVKNRREYAVVKETVLKDPTGGKDTVKHDVQFIAYVADDEVLFREENGLPFHPSQATTCQAIFEEELGRVSAPSLARRIVQIVEFGKGVPLRGTGGIYWIPDAHMFLWDAVAGICQKASSKNNLYRLNTAKDDDALVAVSAAIAAQVESSMETLRGEMQRDVGDRAKRTTRKKAALLQKKVEFYEGLFGTTMESVKDSCDDLAETVVVATFAGLKTPSLI